jgi:hypothetical protein
MDSLSEKILKELLPAEKDIVPEAAARPVKRKQAPHSDHWSAAVLLERAAYLSKLAKHGDGSTSETLKDYPRHCAMLSFRSHILIICKRSCGHTRPVSSRLSHPTRIAILEVLRDGELSARGPSRRSSASNRRTSPSTWRS